LIVEDSDAALFYDGDHQRPEGGRLARRLLAQVPALAGPGLARGDEPEAASELVLVGDLGVVGEVLAAALRVRLERLVAALLGVLDRAVDDQLAAVAERAAGVVEDVDGALRELGVAAGHRAPEHT